MAVEQSQLRSLANWGNAIAVLASTLLTACGWLSDLNQQLFGEKEDDWRVAALEEFPARFRAKEIWSQSIGAAEGTALKRHLLSQGNVVFGCSPDGAVSAFAVRNGKRLWDSRFNVTASFCIGGSGPLLLIGSVAGDVIAFAAKNGRQLWSTRLRGGAINAISKVHRNQVLVRSANGNITALSAHSGKLRWQIKEKLPALTLRGMSIPLLYDNTGLVGLEDGRLIILSLDDGRILQELRVGLMKKGDDLERIVDIDGNIGLHDGILYVTSYQGRTLAFDLTKNKVLWTAEASSYQGVAIGNDAVYLVASDGKLLKLDRYVGSEMWANAAFSIRELTIPLVLNKWIIVGDNAGHLYWVDAEDGSLLARFDTQDEIVSPPLRSGNRVIAVNRDGDLFAVRIAARIVAAEN